MGQASTSDERAVPLYIPMTVSNDDPEVLNVTVPEDGAVHTHQTVLIGEL